ncbi:MAG: polysaccharide biosynthesis C-terminal domain-containing protein [Candidatus Falkowbacteria bacterium]
MINTTAQNTIKNSIYNFIGFLLPILILVIFTPIIISKLGVRDYGIFIFLNTVLTFLGLLDLGIGTATNKHVIEYYSTNQTDRLKKLLYSMNSIYLIMAFVYLFVCITIGLVMQKFFVKPGTETDYFILFLILGLTGFVGAFFANFNNSIIAMQRYDIYLKISSIFLLLSNISMLVLASLGYKLVPILAVQLFLSLFSGLSFFFIAKKVLSSLKLKYAWDKIELIKNYKFALPVAFNNLASSSLVHFDKLLVPMFYGSAALTYYSVPGSVATKISTISGTFSSLLFPITVNLQALNDTEKIKRVYIRSVRLITILSSAIALSIIFTADKILLYWLNDSFVKQSAVVLILLVLTNFVLALFSPLSNLLMAMNKMRFLTTGSVIMALINIITLFIFLPKYGINGAALSYLISVLFVFYMFHFAEKKYFSIKENIHLKLLIKIILTTIPFFVITRFLLYPLITSFVTLALVGPTCVLLFLLLYKVLGFVEIEDWRDFLLSFRNILVKLKLKNNL